MTETTASSPKPASQGSLATALSIVDFFCRGASTKEVTVALGLTASQVNTVFADIQTKACLPKERKTYQACASEVRANMDRYKQHLANMDQLIDSYLAAQTNFKF